MGVAGITRAVLLAVNTATKATYDAVYGGEPLLTRALVALSKAGIRSVWIICHEGDREKIAALIGKARTRLALDYDICPIRTGETLFEVVSRIVEQWDTSFCSSKPIKLSILHFLRRWPNLPHHQSRCSLSINMCG